MELIEDGEESKYNSMPFSEYLERMLIVELKDKVNELVTEVNKLRCELTEVKDYEQSNSAVQETVSPEPELSDSNEYGQE